MKVMFQHDKCLAIFYNFLWFVFLVSDNTADILLNIHDAFGVY